LVAAQVVWLDAPVDVLAARLSADGERAKRPLLAGGDDLVASLEETLAKRSELYAQSDIRVSLGGDESPSDVADRVIDDAIAFIKANPPKSAPPPE